jgi:hypothetical protein
MARVFANHGTSLLAYTRVAVQAWSKPVMNPGTKVYLGAVARDHGLSYITRLSRDAVVRSKNRDKFIYFIVRVMVRYVNCQGLENY